MQMSDELLRVALAQITVRRSDRQRRSLYTDKGQFIDSDGLVASVKAKGVLNPLIVTRDFTLVAGERRLEASKLAGRTDVPVRFIEDLDEAEAREVELEENLKRTDLPWRDEVAAIAELHALYKSRNPAHTQADTSRLIGYDSVAEALRVARDLDSPRIVHASGMRQAYNVLSRIDDRKAADAVNDIIDGAAAIFSGAATPPQPEGAGTTAPPQGGTASPITHAVPPARPTATDSPDIMLGDFIEWSRTYSGPSFNFIHCDFPYGIDPFSGPQGRMGASTVYADTPDIYDALIRALCSALPRIMSHSAHLMFWLTADIGVQWRTLEMFRALAPSLTFAMKPLIWHKTDNVGVLADPKRGPRHVYETALIASQEDRLIAKAVSDAYGAPTDKSHHPSAKPEPVLRHFMQMFIDDCSLVLDPTCGGGSSLRAAESLGARRVFGIERDPEHYNAAQSAMRTFRTLRRVSK